MGSGLCLMVSLEARRGGSPVPAALCVPSKRYPVDDEDRRGCRVCRIRKKRADKESVLDVVCGDGRSGDRASGGSDNGTAGCRDDYRDGAMRLINCT